MRLRCAHFALLFLVAAPACATRSPSPALAAPTLPERFPAGGGARNEAELARWWDKFGDPALTAIVDRALVSNQDLAIASARLEQARAGAKGADAQLWPTLDATAGVSRQRASLEDPQVRNAAQAPGYERSQTTYREGVTLGWELDIFGRNRARTAAQGELALAAEASRAATALAVAGDAAQAVVTARTLQERLRLARLAVDTETDLVKLTRAKLAGGQVSETDVYRAEALVFDSAANADRLESDLAATLSTLSLLLATTPAEAMTLLGPAPKDPLKQVSPLTHAGIPAELLQRRPDILQAAARFRATTHDREAAERDRFPVLQIAGTLALVAGTTATLGTSDAVLASFGPSVSWRALDFGRMEAAIDRAVGTEKESLLHYKQMVLRAFAETELALSDLARRDGALEHARSALVAQRHAWELVRAQFDGGVADATAVLDTRRTLTRAEESFAIATQQRLVAGLVAYRALGGGW